ncbi:MAG: HAMP domain-containing histidine kinase [Firmicutes bacterium]|nr:HAMP domain-containing histidine kinase [Bacillota bacterium]MBR7148326.1 HAMP domain-containing histidine kinase [Bacillota bacterium]
MKFPPIDKLNKKKRTTSGDSVSSKMLDFRSIYFRLWMTFLAFAIVLMIVLWILEIAMLQPFYQASKTGQIYKAGQTIAEAYSYPERLDTDELIDTMTTLSYDNDMYFYMAATDNSMVIAPNPIRRYIPEMVDSFELIREKLAESASNTVTFTIDSPNDQDETMVYGALVESRHRSPAILCIYAPLSPVDANVDILKDQLMTVTFISLILAFALSLYLAKRISSPLVALKNQAARLAKGEYGIEFDSHSYTEIDNLADTLNHTSKELAKTEELHRDLVANMSHDLRTPLTMIKSYAEMIRDLSGNNEAKRNAHLAVIIDETDRLNRLVSDMLLLSKMQSGVVPMNKERFDLNHSLRKLIQTYEAYQERQGCPITFDTNAEEAYIFGDESQLLQVASNLINNAVRYASEGGSIEVYLRVTTIPVGFTDSKAASTPMRTVTVRVQDHGPGIPEDQLPHIWDRYYKYSRTGTRSSGSSGLGLAIVKEILLAHKARFGVRSSMGKGSTFWFTLPLEQDQTPEPTTPSETE